MSTPIEAAGEPIEHDEQVTDRIALHTIDLPDEPIARDFIVATFGGPDPGRCELSHCPMHAHGPYTEDEAKQAAEAMPAWMQPHILALHREPDPCIQPAAAGDVRPEMIEAVTLATKGQLLAARMRDWRSEHPDHTQAQYHEAFSAAAAEIGQQPGPWLHDVTPHQPPPSGDNRPSAAGS